MTELTLNQKRDLVRACPAGVFDIEDMDLVISRPDKCIGCVVCIEKGLEYLKKDDEDHPIILTLEPNKRTYRFTIEPVGQVNTRTILRHLRDTNRLKVEYESAYVPL